MQGVAAQSHEPGAHDKMHVFFAIALLTMKLREAIDKAHAQEVTKKIPKT